MAVMGVGGGASLGLALRSGVRNRQSSTRLSSTPRPGAGESGGFKHDFEGEPGFVTVCVVPEIASAAGDEEPLGALSRWMR